MKLFQIVICLLVLCSIELVLSSERKKLEHKKLHYKGRKNRHEEENTLAEIRSPKYNGLDKKGKPLPLPTMFPDYNRDFQNDFTELERILKNHAVTKGEARNIFSIIDINNDNQLNDMEWRNFRRIFVEPFEKCDADQDYFLSEEELLKCMSDTDDFRFIEDDKRKENVSLCMEVLNTGEKKTNFAGYMYLRRSALAWRECVEQNKDMGMGNFGCAISIATMGKTKSMSDPTTAFSAALKLYGVKPAKETLSYPQFLRIFWTLNVYTNFDQPIPDGRVTRKEFKKAIVSGVLPTKVNFKFVEDVFLGLNPTAEPEDTTGIRFGTYAILSTWYDKFMRVSSYNDHISFSQFCELLDEKIIKNDLTALVDKCLTNYSEDLLKASSSSPDLNNMLNEKDYIMFLERYTKKSRYSKKAHKEDQVKCEDIKGVELKYDPSAARKQLFHILDANQDNTVSFPEFIFFLKFGYSFQFFDPDRDGRVVANEIAPIMIDKIAPIPLTAYETATLRNFKTLEINGRLDILQYIAYSASDAHFFFYLIVNTNTLVVQPNLSRIFDNLNLHIIPRDMAVCAIGKNQHPRAYYNYKKCLRATFQTHVTALQAMVEKSK